MNNFRQDIIEALIFRGQSNALNLAKNLDYDVYDVFNELQEMKAEGLVRTTPFVLTPEQIKYVIIQRADWEEPDFVSELPAEILEARYAFSIADLEGCEQEHIEEVFVYHGGPISQALARAEQEHA